MPYPLGVRGDRVEPAPRSNAIRLGVDDVRICPRARVLVALLDQKPALVPAVLAAVTLDEHPSAMKLLAVQDEFELALLVCRLRVALGLPVPAIPQQNGARSVLLRRYHALEIAILERVILDVHREALVRGVEARPLGDRPAQQDTVQLQPKVVVKVRRLVFLDDEDRLIGPTPTDDSGRLRCRLEVALLAIEFKRHRD